MSRPGDAPPLWDKQERYFHQPLREQCSSNSAAAATVQLGAGVLFSLLHTTTASFSLTVALFLVDLDAHAHIEGAVVGAAAVAACPVLCTAARPSPFARFLKTLLSPRPAPTTSRPTCRAQSTMPPLFWSDKEQHNKHTSIHPDKP